MLSTEQGWKSKSTVYRIIDLYLQKLKKSDLLDCGLKNLCKLRNIGYLFREEIDAASLALSYTKLLPEVPFEDIVRKRHLVMDLDASAEKIAEAVNMLNGNSSLIIEARARPVVSKLEPVPNYEVDYELSDLILEGMDKATSQSFMRQFRLPLNSEMLPSQHTVCGKQVQKKAASC